MFLDAIIFFSKFLILVGLFAGMLALLFPWVHYLGDRYYAWCKKKIEVLRK